MSGVTVTQFDYSTIDDKDQRGKLISLEGRVKKLYAGVASSIIEIGQVVSSARSVLGNQKNGQFLKWVEGACGFSERTAYNYMNAFDRFGNVATVASFEDSALYALATPKVSQKAVTEATKLADKGVRITGKLAKELIAKHSNGKSKSSPVKPAPVKPPEPYKPRHSDSVEDDTEKCPNCGCTWWRPVQGGGHDCDKCCHPMGEPVGDTDESEEPKETGDLEQAEISKPVEGALKKARAALGVLVRYCDDMKLSDKANPHLQALAKLIGK